MNSISAQEDLILCDKVIEAILRNIGGIEKLKEEFPRLLRKALDEVIDTPRTRRTRLDQIEKTEKTYIGTKVEILFRNYIGFPKGVLDLEIEGIDVDIKHTVSKNWMIPVEAFGKPCILISENEQTAKCNLGIFIARPEYLSVACNRDKKKTIPVGSYKHVKWLLQDHPYPENFWQTIDASVVQQIFAPKGGTERLIRFFTEVQGVPIARNLVEGVAAQADYMKRLRRNGGARDSLARKGIVVLWGGKTSDKRLIKDLNLPYCNANQFISFKAMSATDAALIAPFLS